MPFEINASCFNLSRGGGGGGGELLIVFLHWAWLNKVLHKREGPPDSGVLHMLSSVSYSCHLLD